jgi:RHS repeat-associated protein
VRAITDAAGAKVESATYNPFGEQTEFVAPGLAAPETKGWIGERYDADAGLQYLNARYYDPSLGMFLQPDWFEVLQPGVGTNRFSYSFNDPVNLSDPMGNRTIWEAIGDAFRTPAQRVQVNTERANQAARAVGELQRQYANGDINYDGYEERRRTEVSAYQSYVQIVANNGGSAGGIALDIAVGAINNGVGLGSLRGVSGAATAITGRATAAVPGAGVAFGLPVFRVHGNSLLSMRPQTMYNLIRTEGGEIVKIGIAETAIIGSRYSGPVLSRYGLELVSVAPYSNRLIALGAEGASIAGYMLRNGGRLPPMQVNFPRGYPF